MTQATMSIQNNEVVGVSALTEEEAIAIATAMLKNYRKLDAEILRRERAAKAGDKKFLTKYQKQLAVVGKAYANQANSSFMHKEKAERFFGQAREHAVQDKRYYNDAAALEELQTYMIGTTAFGSDAHGINGDSATDWKGKIVTLAREHELRTEEMADLEEEKQFIISTISDVASVDPRAHEILFLQYILGWKVAAVIEDLTKRYGLGIVADSTYHHWRKEAVKLFARFAGLC